MVGAVAVQPDLFAGNDQCAREDLRPGITLLRGFAAAPEIAAALVPIVARAPFRHMRTPGGHEMSVAMTNCGTLGWVTDRSGYRYDPHDPATGLPWPPMPAVWRRLATDAARDSGFDGFEPDACLVNRYDPGARMGLHRDSDETDFSQPIVSVSLGISAVFLLGGPARRDKTVAIPLNHGDALVFGGPERLVYHGVRPVKAGPLPAADGAPGDHRINLTFRRAR